MSRIPVTQYDPPFAITRASHLVLTSQDLAASERFYTQVAGMVLTHKDDRRLYLRGLEEACHHSLVIAYSKAEPHCERIGLRVFQERDLAAAKRFWICKGLKTTGQRCLFRAAPCISPIRLVRRSNCAPACR